MDITREIADEQSKRWNGPAGRAWVEAQELLDRILKPFEDMLVEEAVAGSRHDILDVGCGAGATTVAMARQLAPEGRCVGIDISDPMITAARALAERNEVRATFICADAETYAFASARFDLIVSRFGVMFFANPVRAFANLRQAATADAGLRCIAWRSAEENPFMTTAERAAAPLLPNLPPRRPDVPGQFAFADRERVGALLEDSGWTDVDIRPLDVICSLPETELTRYVTRLGPVGLALQDADEPTRARVTDTVRAAFGPYVHGSEVRFTAACWDVAAHS